MLAFVHIDFVFNSLCCLSANVNSILLSVPFWRMLFCFYFQLSSPSYVPCCVVPLCHYSACLPTYVYY